MTKAWLLHVSVTFKLYANSRCHVILLYLLSYCLKGFKVRVMHMANALDFRKIIHVLVTTYIDYHLSRNTWYTFLCKSFLPLIITLWKVLKKNFNIAASHLFTLFTHSLCGSVHKIWMNVVFAHRSHTKKEKPWKRNLR